MPENSPMNYKGTGMPEMAILYNITWIQSPCFLIFRELSNLWAKSLVSLREVSQIQACNLSRPGSLSAFNSFNCSIICSSALGKPFGVLLPSIPGNISHFCDVILCFLRKYKKELCCTRIPLGFFHKTRS